MQLMVLCTDVGCPLHETGRTIETLRATGIYLPNFDEAKDAILLCSMCQAAKPQRGGTLVYMPIEEFCAVNSQLLCEAGMGGDPYWQAVARETSAIPSTNDAVASLDADAKPRNGVPVGVALDTLPYGGYLLRFGDKDESKQFGPRQDGLPLQDPAKPNYILQLQDDLMFMGYWNTARAPAPAKPKPGEYHYSMIGAVLALKEDLTTFYGVPATTDLNAAKITLDNGSKLNLVGLDMPIYYDRSLRNPVRRYFVEVLDPISEARGVALSVAAGWRKALKDQKGGKFTKTQRATLKKLVDSTTAALAVCNQAIDRANVLGGHWNAPASADALLSDPVFEIDKRAGKACWDSFAKAVEEWESSRTDSGMEPISACAASLNTFTPPADEHSDAIERCAALQAAYGRLFVALETAVPLGWDVLGALPGVLGKYQARLREFATVDWATAAYIHAIRNYIPIGSGNGAIKRPGGVLVFRFPDDGVDHDAPATINDVYELAIAEAKTKAVPPQLVIERFAGESGFTQTYAMRSFAATKAHKGVRLTLMGTDFANWAPSGRSKSVFCYSEMFTGGPGDWDRGGGRGYMGPIIMSRGWGVSQTTLGTHLKDVTPKGRASEYEDRNWVLGIPVSKTGAPVEVPYFMASTRGIVENGVALLGKKYKVSALMRKCTFPESGGAKHDCHRCLKRFDPERDFIKDGNSYRLGVETARLIDLFGLSEAEAAEFDRRELPCSWLTAIMRYAGTGDRAFARLKKTAKIVANPRPNSMFEEYIKKLSK